MPISSEQVAALGTMPIVSYNRSTKEETKTLNCECSMQAASSDGCLAAWNHCIPRVIRRSDDQMDYIKAFAIKASDYRSDD
jgi:hypothetical protein